MSGKHTGPQPSSCGESIFLLGPQAQKWIKQAHHVFTGMWSGQSRSQVMGISIVGHQCLVTHPQMEADSYCLHFEELRLRKMRWCVSVRQLAGSRLCYGVHSPPSAVSTSWRGSHCVTGQGACTMQGPGVRGLFLMTSSVTQWANVFSLMFSFSKYLYRLGGHLQGARLAPRKDDNVNQHGIDAFHVPCCTSHAFYRLTHSMLRLSLESRYSY